MMRQTGVYQQFGELNYFIPKALPPNDPPLVLTHEIIMLYGEASFALGQLNEMSKRLPDIQRFIRAYVIKEALLSSAIEGIHTTLIDVYTHKIGDSQTNKETQLVLNYTAALNNALDMMQNKGLPLVNRVILSAHEYLLSLNGDEKANPGQFRKLPVKVGELVPPPAQEIPRLMQELERFINEPQTIPDLINAGLMHVQFETIHPFLDGNGRIGRLLIVLMLLQSNLLVAPVLYPSLYFKTHVGEYYDCLNRVRTHGDFEGWIVYYLKAIKTSALDAYKRAKDIEELEITLKSKIQTDKAFAKMRDTAQTTLDFLFTQPIASISSIAENTDKSFNTIKNIVALFANEGILLEATASRSKQYRFAPYLDLLEKSYELS